MRNLAAILLAPIAALGAFAVFHPSGPATAGDPCYDKASSQAELNRCADVDARASQRRLETAYASLQKTVSGAELRGVQVDQRAWQAYRNANCDSASGVSLTDAGSMAPMVNLQCYAQRNDQRIAYLRWRAEPVEQRQNHRMP